MISSIPVPKNNQLETEPDLKTFSFDLEKEESSNLSSRSATSLAIPRGMTRRHEDDCEIVKASTLSNRIIPVDKDLQQMFYRRPLAPGHFWPFPPGHYLDWQTSKCYPNCCKCDVKRTNYDFHPRYYTQKKDRVDSGTFEEVFANGYPKGSIIDRRSRPLDCPGCEKARLAHITKKLLVEQLSKYTTEQMIRRDIRNISNVKYPLGSINYLIAAYIKENINFDWVSRSEEDLKYLNKRKMFYEKTNKPEDATRAQCFAVLIENLDVVVLQDANVLRMQEFKPNYAILEQQWLRTVFPNLHVS